MTFTRGQLLTLGPLILVAVCYAVAAPGSSSVARVRQPEGLAVHDQIESDPKITSEKCQSVASQLRQQLTADWNVVVHDPFVLGGDCDLKRLNEAYRHTILPTAQALRIQYFDQPPTWPVTILLCSTDASYRECQRRLGERERSEYSGVYSRTEHRVVINVATGDGTLAHELTHALAHADFPSMPEWFDEGLASLHEECEFSTDGLRLIGLDNWRRGTLREAVQLEQLRPLTALVADRFATADHAASDYAHARYFCLFLQQRRLLEPFYRKCRSRAAADPTGVISLCELFATRRPAEIDTQFQTWLNKSASRTP